MAKIYIIFYSTYGHIEKLARKVKQGVDAVAGVEGVLYQVAETLPAEVLEKMHAPPKPADVPVISAKDLADADGFIFGFPTRFGTMPAQVKALFDATGGLWMSGALAGKAASIFTSTGSQGSGQESTIITSLPVLAHHGLIYVPLGYTYGGDKLSDVETARGGTAWGAGTLAGNMGQRQPSELELDVARHQGEYVAKIVKKLTA